MPSPFRRSSSAAASPSARKGQTSFSFIGADVVIRGDICTPAELHVDGTVEGDISCATLTQGESGRIVGNIVADHARISGQVDGTINVASLVIERSARANGDVSYDSINVEVGAHVDGRFARRGGEAIGVPAELKLIASE